VVSRRRIGLADPLGLVMFFVIGFWWYALIAIERPEMLGYFIGEEIVARNLTGSAQRNPQWYAPITVYLPTLLLGAAPWLYFALARRGSGFSRSTREVWSRIPRDLEGLATFWWFVVPLLVFCLSRSRLPLYMLQVLPPLGLWTASSIHRGKTTDRTILAVAVSTMLAFSIAKGVSARVPVSADAGRLYAKVTEVGGRGTSIKLVENRESYGLEFYSRGRLTRVSIGSRPPWADDTLAGVVEDIAQGREPRDFTFVVDPSRAGAVQSKLTQASVHYGTTEALDRVLVFASPVAGRNGDRAH
jgi:4-amino-4-deoxy-L-arabinose transferase